jgi:2-dehydro-3-deoxyphosphooctonate aldolase (KDO 8-P synthase)
LKKIKDELQVPVLTDVHEVADVAKVAEVVDVLQIPAFLCRQTDLVVAAALSGRAVNIKKGQFVSPWDMRHAVEKCREAGNTQVFLTERGTSFGYNNLVVDMRSLSIMRKFAPVVFDATHSVQLPSAQADDHRASGQRRSAGVYPGPRASGGGRRRGWRFPGSA